MTTPIVQQTTAITAPIAPAPKLGKEQEENVEIISEKAALQLAATLTSQSRVSASMLASALTRLAEKINASPTSPPTPTESVSHSDSFSESSMSGTPSVLSPGILSPGTDITVPSPVHDRHNRSGYFDPNLARQLQYTGSSLPRSPSSGSVTSNLLPESASKSTNVDLPESPSKSTNGNLPESQSNTTNATNLPESPSTSSNGSQDVDAILLHHPLPLDVGTHINKEHKDDYYDEKHPEQVTTAAELSIGQRILKYLDGHYILTNPSPAIVYPRAPSDADKYSYVNTRRPIYLSLGLFTFLSASAGLWLFTLASPAFYWYGPVAALLQLHISISFVLGIFSRDFDLKAHNELLARVPINDETAPTVDIYLPVCKEPITVLRNTWNHVAKMKYPKGKLNVYVLDDGAQDDVQTMAQVGFGFHYIRRDDRPYFRKAGNLRYAFARTSGDFFVIFDADFCPRDDFLLESIPRMIDDPQVAILQTPQFFRTVAENTWVERGASEVQELFYRWTQVNRNNWGASICVGSCAVYRREALKETGGTALVGASEDVHTGFYAITRGWKLRYMPLCMAAGISPDTPRACFSQQIRWSQGSTSLLLNGDFHKAKLGFKTKVCFLSGMLYYWTSSIAMFTIPLPGLLIMWVKPNKMHYFNLAFAMPSIVYGVLVFRFWSSGAHSLATQQIKILQGYAYLFGIKDRIMGKAHEWVPSGGNSKSHKKSSLYSKARAVAITWTVMYQGAFVSGTAYRLIQVAQGSKVMTWYDPIPQIILYAFNLYITLPFLLSR